MKAKQVVTLAAALLTGHASNVTGAAWVIATKTAGDGIAHNVTIRNDSANDHSGKTIVLSGQDANGKQITETLAGPAGSATVTSTKAFKVLDTAVVSATIGADTFDIGWTAKGHGPWIDLKNNRTPFSASVGIFVGGTLNYDIQHTYEDNPQDDSPAFSQSALTSKTATLDGAYNAPVTAVRVNVNSHTSGTFTFFAMQGDQ